MKRQHDHMANRYNSARAESSPPSPSTSWPASSSPSSSATSASSYSAPVPAPAPRRQQLSLAALLSPAPEDNEEAMSQSDVRQGQSYYLTHHTTHGWTATPLPLVKKEPFDLDQSGPDGGGSPMSSPTPHSSPEHTTRDLVVAASTSMPYAGPPTIRTTSSSKTILTSSFTSPTFPVSPRRAADTNINPSTSSSSSSSDIKSCSQCGRVHSPCWRRGPNRTMLCNSCGLKHARKLRKGKDEEETNDREAVVVGPPGRASDHSHIHSTTTNNYTIPKATRVNEAAHPGHGHGHGHSFVAMPPVAPHGALTFPLISLFPPPISSASTASPSPASSSKPAWPSPLPTSLSLSPSPAQPLGLSSLFPAAAVPTHHSSTLANAASSLLHLATGGPPSTAAAAACSSTSSSSSSSSSSPVTSPWPSASTTTTTTTTSNATTAPHHHLPPSPLPELYAALASAASATSVRTSWATSSPKTLADYLALLFAHNTAAYLSLLASVVPQATQPPPPPVLATTEVNPAAGLQQLSHMLQHHLQPPQQQQQQQHQQPQQHQKHQQQHSELQQRLRQLQLQLQLPTLLPAAKVHPQPPPPPQPQPPVVPVGPPTLTLPPLSSLCDIFRSLPPQPQHAPLPHSATPAVFPPPMPPKTDVAALRAPLHQAKLVALQAALRPSVPGLQHRQPGVHRPAPSSASSSSSPSPPLSSSAPSSFPLAMKCSSPSSLSSPSPSSSSSSSSAAAAVKLGRGKRKMKTYTCRTCQLPKKGHICPSPLDSSSPASSPPSSPRADSSPAPNKKRRRNKTAPPEAKERGARAAANSSPSPSSLPTVTFVSRAFSWSSREPKAS